MAKQNNNSFQNLELDDYEQEIENLVDPQKDADLGKVEKQKLIKAAQVTLQKITKKKNINFRVAEQDLKILKHRATQKGIPYQTLLTSLVHQYTTGQVQIGL